MTGPEQLFRAERAEVERILARMSRATEELNEVTRVQLADLREHRAIWAAEDAERAKQARNGELGPQWQRLQRRIDLNETSLADVVSGADGSAEAAAVRQQAENRAAELYAEQLADLESEEPSELQSELNAVRAEVERLRQAISKAVELGDRPYGSIGVAEVRASAPLEET
jgi:hypothetical protein